MTAKYLAAINIKEKSHEAHEYNYLHFTLQKPRLRGICLMVKCRHLCPRGSVTGREGAASSGQLKPQEHSLRTAQD